MTSVAATRGDSLTLTLPSQRRAATALMTGGFHAVVGKGQEVLEAASTAAAADSFKAVKLSGTAKCVSSYERQQLPGPTAAVVSASPLPLAHRDEWRRRGESSLRALKVEISLLLTELLEISLLLTELLKIILLQTEFLEISFLITELLKVSY